MALNPHLASYGASAPYLQPGQELKVPNPHGDQVVDAWAFMLLSDGCRREIFGFK